MCTCVCVCAHRGTTQWRREGETFLHHSFSTMRVPASGAAVSRICPLAVFLCVVVQSSYGSLTQPSPRPSTRPKLQPEPSFLPSSIPNPKPNSLPEASQLSSANPSLRHKPQISPSPNPPQIFTPQFSSILFFKPLASLPISNSSPKFKLQSPPKHNPKTKQGPASKSRPKRVSRNSSDNPKPSVSNSNTFLLSNSKSNIKSSFASLSSPSYSNTKVVSKPSPNFEPSALSNPSSKFSSLSSPNVKQNMLSEAADPKYNPHARLSSQSNPKVHSKVRPFSQADINTNPNSKQLSELNPRASVRPQRNQTKFLDTDKDSHHRPKRGWIWNQFFVLEEHIGPEPQYVGKLHSNSDKGDGTVRYILSGEGAGSIFVIDETTGDIQAAKSLDRERKSQYVLHARAIDRWTNRSLEAESEFIIKVQDVNDNAPTFLDGPFSATVPEMSDVGTSVFQVTASDADDPTYGNSAKIVYSILEGQPYFSVDPKTGVIRTAVSSMDRESRDRYMVVIQAKDMAGSVGGLSGSTTVNVTLTDVNDNPPKFSQKSYQLYVPESAPVGKAVGRIRANDEDEGENAAMVYTITNTDAATIFSISTDSDHREGIISLKQALNYENRKAHTLHIEGANAHTDSRFSHLGPFKDSTSLRVIVGDVDEPPIFSMDYYIMDVYENSPAGTQVGTVTAVDPDSTNSAVRYFIEKDEDRHLYFTIGVNNGVIRATQSLDREAMAWHNISVMAAEVDNPRLVSHVPVTIQVLDVNDNVPSIAGGGDDIIVCQSTKNGQVIQTLRPVDLDNFANGKFSFSLPADEAFNPNFTLKDNGDNTASILSHRRGVFSQDGDREVFQLPVVVGDGGEPPLSSTATLTLRVCVCERNSRGRSGGNVCRAQAFLSSAGLSTGAFVAILLCIIILLAIVMLFAQLRSKKTSKEPLILSEEDIRENVVTYDDEGGGEEDTEAFDIAALRNPAASERTRKFHTYHGHPRRQCREDDELEEEEEGGDGDMVVVRKKRGKEADYREYSPELEPTWLMIGCVPRDISQSAPSLAPDSQEVIHRVLRRKVAEADTDTRGPPYDSLQTYAYEGRGSLAGSVSSLGLTDPVQDLELESQTLERLFGECPTTNQP